MTNWKKKSSDHVAPKVSDLKARPRRIKEQTRQRIAETRQQREVKRREEQNRLAGRREPPQLRKLGKRFDGKPELARPQREKHKAREAWAQTQQLYLRRMSKRQDQWQGFADRVACGMERTPLLDEPMRRA